MKLISAKSSTARPAQTISSYTMLDSAEMELTLQELGASPSGRLTQVTLSPDLLNEYASCASMIMDRQEREEVARQLLRAQRQQQRAA